MFINISNPNYYNLYFVAPIICFWTAIIFCNLKYFQSLLLKILNYTKDKINITWVSFLFLIPSTIIAWTLPLTYDESYTFLQFVNKSFFYAIATYPAPNNHIFHSILSNLIWHLFGWIGNPIIVRIPALFFSFLLINVVFTNIKNHKLFYTILFSCALLLNLPFLSYTFQARGYIFQALFATLSLIVIFKNSENITFKHQNELLLLLSGIGLYTSPAYLYSFLTFYAVFLIKNLPKAIDNYLWLLKSAFFFTLTIITLYSPVIIFRGYESLISNKFVRSMETVDFDFIIQHYFQVLIEISGGYIYFTFLLITIIYFARKNRRPEIIILFILPLVLMIVLKQIPFSRIFLPIIIGMTSLCVLDFADNYKIPKKIENILSPIILVLLLIFIPSCFLKTSHGGIDTSSNIKSIGPYLHKNILIDNSTQEHVKICAEALLTIKKIKYQKGSFTNTSLKEGDVILFTEPMYNLDVFKLDSVTSYGKKVYIGKKY